MGESWDMNKGCVTLERKNADELNEPISREEVEACLRKQKNCKAAGMDEIPYELYKNGGRAVLND